MAEPGFLLRGTDLISFRRLPFAHREGPPGGPTAKGELSPKCRQGFGHRGGRYLLCAQAGYSRTLEITGRLKGGRLACRRIGPGPEADKAGHEHEKAPA
jgi:hypothetical protein